MAIQRTEPAYELSERVMLERWLEYERATLAVKCDGLDDTQLRERSVPPSSMSLLGLVRHMAEVERHWFHRVLVGADAPPLFYSEENVDGDFDDVDSASVAEAFTAWNDACAGSRENASAHTLDDTGFHPREQKEVSLRWIYVHMIEEYARHNGHADLLRERIDGAVGE